MKYFISLILFISFYYSTAQIQKKYKGLNNNDVPKNSTELLKGKTVIKIKVDGINDTICKLFSYYGNNQYLVDTIKINKKGVFFIETKHKLANGLYSIQFFNNINFDFVVNEEYDFEFECNAKDLIQSIKVKKSLENKALYEYLKFDIKKNTDLADAILIYKSDTSNLKIRQEIIYKEFNESIKSLNIKYKDLLAKKIIEIKFDNNRIENMKSVQISTSIKNAFFDQIDWGYDLVLNSPYFSNKLDIYFNRILPQDVDSVINNFEVLIEKTKNNKEFFRYIVWSALNFSEQSKIMGIDAFTIFLYKKYYLSGKAFWANEKSLERIREQVKLKEPLLLGKVLPNAFLKDSTNTYKRLWDVKSDYTIVFFYDPNCGHCQHEAPKLYEYFLANKSNVMVYAASVDRNLNDWKSFISKSNFTEWVNVFDIDKQTDFRKTYDINSIPVIYVLDKDKKIIAKRLTTEKLKVFMNNYLQKTGK